MTGRRALHFTRALMKPLESVMVLGREQAALLAYLSHGKPTLFARNGHCPRPQAHTPSP